MRHAPSAEPLLHAWHSDTPLQGTVVMGSMFAINVYLPAEWGNITLVINHV
jgi:hypothetical protein